MLLVQEFLKNNSFAKLAFDHGVNATFSQCGRKCSMNYDQIEAKESDLLSQQCRGLILSLADGSAFPLDNNGKREDIIPGETKIISYGFDRFFNYGQGACADINWDDPNFTIMEKLDGSLCIVHFDPISNQWHVATRSRPEADVPLNNGLFTFRTLFEKAVQDTLSYDFNHLTSLLDKDITYCFELTTPYNRIVVDYKDCRITLLGARNVNTLQEIELTDSQLTKLNVPIVKTYKFNNVNELVDWVSTLNPMESEGVVAKDSSGRMKIKNASYVAFSRARDVLGSSERNCLELIFHEKEDDVIAFIPEEIANNLIKIKAGLQVMLKEYDQIYKAALDEANAISLNDRKTFALLITKNSNIWNAPMFAMYGKKANNMKEFIVQAKKEGTWPNSFLDMFLGKIKENYLNK